MLRGYMLLGAITPDAATEEVFPASKVTGTAGQNQSVRNIILASVKAGQIVDANGSPAYIPGTSECAAAAGSSGLSNLQLAQTASGLALTGTTIGLTAAGVVTAGALAPFTLGISALIGLFPLLFGHHAQAVKKEQSTLCAAVPAANNYLQIINQAVQTRQATPAQAIAALNSLMSDFKSQVSSILKGSIGTGTCNAACVEIASLQAIVDYETSVYQDMASAGTTSVTSGNAATPGVVTSGSTLTVPPATSAASIFSGTNWLPIAALAVVGILLFKGL